MACVLLKVINVQGLSSRQDFNHIFQTEKEEKKKEKEEKIAAECW